MSSSHGYSLIIIVCIARIRKPTIMMEISGSSSVIYEFNSTQPVNRGKLDVISSFLYPVLISVSVT